jgi:hypothetical protein
MTGGLWVIVRPMRAHSRTNVETSTPRVRAASERCSHSVLLKRMLFGSRDSIAASGFRGNGGSLGTLVLGSEQSVHDRLHSRRAPTPVEIVVHAGPRDTSEDRQLVLGDPALLEFALYPCHGDAHCDGTILQTV